MTTRQPDHFKKLKDLSELEGKWRSSEKKINIVVILGSVVSIVAKWNSIDAKLIVIIVASAFVLRFILRMLFWAPYYRKLKEIRGDGGQ
jgi:hypothetical protein